MVACSGVQWCGACLFVYVYVFNVAGLLLFICF
jgi:hypothetical protein